MENDAIKKIEKEEKFDFIHPIKSWKKKISAKKEIEKEKIHEENLKPKR
jgi:hypothetical protein